MRVRRPFHVLTVAGTSAHHGYELASGVGLVSQPQLGLGGAAAAWGTLLSTSLVMAARESSRWSGLLAAQVGISLAGVVTHFLLWPWRLRRGLPTLIAAEGLRPEQLAAYNAILHAWGLAALLALARETPRGARRWAWAGVVAAPLLRASARHHFTWADEQARQRPAWWNRGFQGREPVAPA